MDQFHKVLCFSIAITTVYLMLFLFGFELMADEFLGLVGTIFLWHGLWNLTDLLELQLNLNQDKAKSSAFFTTAGLIMVALEAHKHTFHKILNSIKTW